MMTNTKTTVERTPSPAVSLVDVPVTIPMETVLQQWADRITDASGQAVEKIQAIGRLLLEAKKAIKHGQWQRLFKGHPHAVANPVPFSVATAKMHMAIAAHPVLANRNLSNVLPPSWRVLYELTLLSEAELQEFMARGLITPQLRQIDVQVERRCLSTTWLRPPTPEVRKRHRKDCRESIYGQGECQVLLRKYVDNVNQALSEPLVIGDDGKIQSGVLWLTPVPGERIAPAAKPIHQCTCSTCGHVHTAP